MKPILFNTAMVRAILDGRKTVTRRVVKARNTEIISKPKWSKEIYWFNVIKTRNGQKNATAEKIPPPYFRGDILYVRETWRCIEASCPPSNCTIEYKAGGTERFCGIIALPTEGGEWKPSIHMPKEAARIFLRVTDVRVERLQEIMDDPPGPNNQVVREGCKYGCDFIALWENTVKEADKPLYGWDANPFVWRIEFERISQEEAYADAR